MCFGLVFGFDLVFFLGMVVLGVEAGGYLWVRGQPGLHSELQDYIERACLKKNKNQKFAFYASW